MKETTELVASKNLYKDLEDYGIIGNLETCALVGKDGSVDWLCFPYLESPSVFAALLDAERGGHLSLTPAAKYESAQSYEENSNILRTAFTLSDGGALITDFMPVKGLDTAGPVSALFRKVECTAGHVRLSVSLKPRFNYAGAIPDFEPAESGLLSRWKDESLFFQSPVALVIHDGEAKGTLAMKKGDCSWFVLQYGRVSPILPKNCDKILKSVRAFWSGWASKCAGAECIIDDPWHDTVVRSALTLKLLANPDTGAIAAAATTSLPEVTGGVRNWDYRYAWIRDASFTDQAFFHLGHTKESQDFRKWVLGVAARADDPSRISTLYGLREASDRQERVLEYLSGYRNSAPVRIGNGAADQRQLDIYGELLNALYDTTRHGEEVSRENWATYRKIIEYVCGVWDKKDSGIWEVRGELRHFVYSKLMCWVSLDRGIRIAREKGFEAPLQDWEKTREEIRQAIIERGFNSRLNSFVQSFDSEALDATVLLISPMGFLPGDDPRVIGTIDAVMERLTGDNGLVHRYEEEDGLPGKEGCFVLCSCWLVKALALADRTEEAERIFTKLLGYISPLGLFSEEIDPVSGRLLGNFPQAFSHIGVINSAIYLGAAKGRTYKGPKPAGVR